jgi:hypothetical protein
MVEKHPGCQDCDNCVAMQELYGTCEYVAQTERCECDLILLRKQLGRRKKNEQSLLQTESTDRVRYRYWLNKMREDQRKK